MPKGKEKKSGTDARAPESPPAKKENGVEEKTDGSVDAKDKSSPQSEEEKKDKPPSEISKATLGHKIGLALFLGVTTIILLIFWLKAFNNIERILSKVINGSITHFDDNVIDYLFEIGKRIKSDYVKKSLLLRFKHTRKTLDEKQSLT